MSHRGVRVSTFRLVAALVGLGAGVGYAAACVTTGNDPLPAAGTTIGGGHEAGTPLIRLDAGGPPATPPNGEAACPKGACNYQTNGGCDGGSCVPLPGPSGIVPACYAAGTAAAGASCTQWSDCAPGHLCDGTGHCRKLCCGGDWTGCEGGEHCVDRLDLSVDGGPVPTGAMLCMPVGGCDPLVPSSCPTPGSTCQIVDGTGAVACLPEGTGGAGEACPCKGGFLCVLAGNTPICHRLCKAVPGGGEPYCPDSEGICTHYTRDPDGVGECVD
jgi:hypothetical protein